MPKTKNINKEEVRSLLGQGLTQAAVAEILDVTATTIHYHASDENSKKHYINKQDYRNDQRPLIHKIDAFHKKHKSLGAADGKGYNFSVEQLEEKIGNPPVCYLTGRPIDLTDSTAYQLDHIRARSKGGENTLENCGASCNQANHGKYTMSHEEYISLCKDVLEYNGYDVTLI